MEDKDLYREKRRAELDEWKAELDKLKARMRGESADAQIELKRHMDALERRIEEGRAKLAELADSGDDAWDTLKSGVEESWDTLKAGFRDARAKFRD